MAKQLSAHDVIHQIFDSETSEEEEMQDASCSEDVSEEEGTTESATELETTDEELSSSDEGPAEWQARCCEAFIYACAIAWCIFVNIV